MNTESRSPYVSQPITNHCRTALRAARAICRIRPRNGGKGRWKYIDSSAPAAIDHVRTKQRNKRSKTYPGESVGSRTESARPRSEAGDGEVSEEPPQTERFVSYFTVPRDLNDQERESERGKQRKARRRRP